MNAATTSSDPSVIPAASRQRSARRRSMSSSRRSMRVGLAMRFRVGGPSDGPRQGGPVPGPVHSGPARLPSRESPKAAVAALLERGLSACEIDFEGRFWMDYDFAARFGELAAENDIVPSGD